MASCHFSNIYLGESAWVPPHAGGSRGARVSLSFSNVWFELKSSGYAANPAKVFSGSLLAEQLSAGCVVWRLSVQVLLSSPILQHHTLTGWAPAAVNGAASAPALVLVGGWLVARNSWSDFPFPGVPGLGSSAGSGRCPKGKCPQQGCSCSRSPRWGTLRFCRSGHSAGRPTSLC